MPELYVNDKVTTLSASVTTGATTITVADATNFPSPTGGSFFRLRLSPATPDGTYEIVKVTARAGTTLTVTRAQEGTAAVAWASGASVAPVLTAEAVANLVERINAQVTINNPATDIFLRGDVNDDGSNSSNWPNRIAFYFKPLSGVPQLTGYFNEFGELRSRASRPNSVALRVMTASPVGTDQTQNVFEVCSGDHNTYYLQIGISLAEFFVPVKAPNLVSVYKQTTAPSDTNAVWIDIT